MLRFRRNLGEALTNDRPIARVPRPNLEFLREISEYDPLALEPR